MFDIIGKRFWFFLISGIIILTGIISLSTFGLQSGIEFSSGSILAMTFERPIEYAQFQQEMIGLGYADAIIQRTDQGEFLIRTQELTETQKTELEAALAAKFGQLSETQFYSVSPLAASETVRNTGIAVVASMIGILLYVTWAFRRMPRPFRYGTCAVTALLHDVLVTLGLFSLIGGFLNWQINLMFITGILAIIGYSINNTIVIFDRIRENLKMGVSDSFEIVVNDSQVGTLSRSLNTTITTLITVLAVLLFVGATIQNFAVVLLIGLIVGTFDSICVAPALLVVWDKSEWGRFVNWLPLARAKT